MLVFLCPLIYYLFIILIYTLILLILVFSAINVFSISSFGVWFGLLGIELHYFFISHATDLMARVTSFKN
jgi:hypothetical protein